MGKYFFEIIRLVCILTEERLTWKACKSIDSGVRLPGFCSVLKCEVGKLKGILWPCTRRTVTGQDTSMEYTQPVVRPLGKLLPFEEQGLKATTLILTVR